MRAAMRAEMGWPKYAIRADEKMYGRVGALCGRLARDSF